MKRDEIRIGDALEWDYVPSHGRGAQVRQGVVQSIGDHHVALATFEGHGAIWDVEPGRLRPARRGR